eukprot:scaffold110183_cov37-Prasinocladus_malaysianus.AAC.2
MTLLSGTIVTIQLVLSWAFSRGLLECLPELVAVLPCLSLGFCGGGGGGCQDSILQPPFNDYAGDLQG